MEAVGDDGSEACVAPAYQELPIAAIISWSFPVPAPQGAALRMRGVYVNRRTARLSAGLGGLWTIDALTLHLTDDPGQERRSLKCSEFVLRLISQV